jgi:RecJ-like exonuclease
MPEDYICPFCDGTGGTCVDGECLECNGSGYIDPPWTAEGYEDDEELWTVPEDFDALEGAPC